MVNVDTFWTKIFLILAVPSSCVKVEETVDAAVEATEADMVIRNVVWKLERIDKISRSDGLPNLWTMMG